METTGNHGRHRAITDQSDGYRSIKLPIVWSGREVGDRIVGKIRGRLRVSLIGKTPQDLALTVEAACARKVKDDWRHLEPVHTSRSKACEG